MRQYSAGTQGIVSQVLASWSECQYLVLSKIMSIKGDCDLYYEKKKQFYEYQLCMVYIRPQLMIMFLQH